MTAAMALVVPAFLYILWYSHPVLSSVTTREAIETVFALAALGFAIGAVLTYVTQHWAMVYMMVSCLFILLYYYPLISEEQE
ncbi:MAG: hypothetical protein Kow0077_32280 [Anaerolineae bacterium]